MSSAKRWLLSVCALGLLACDDPPPEKAGATSAAAAVAEAPPPAPAPEAKPEAPKKPKKTLADCPKGNEVVFEPSEIEAQVRLKLQKPTGTVTRADLGRLTSLNLSTIELDALDVCFFAHTPKLKELFLGKGQINDLSPIADLDKLESLRASINPIADVSALSKMKNLDRLDLGRTQVADITPLRGLTKLTELQLDDAPVSDISPLSALTKLERLSLQRTRVKDLSPLKDLKELKFLYVQDSPAADDTSVLAPLRSGGLKVFDL